MPQNSMANPCVEQIIAAANGTIDEREATRILRELGHRTRQRAAADSIPMEDAARIVAEEVMAEEKLKAAISKRAKLLSLRAFKRIIDAATSGRGKDLADALIEYMTEAMNAGRFRSNLWLNKLAADLEQAGVLREFKQGGKQMSLDVRIERRQLSMGLPPATENTAAQAIAKSMREIEKQYMAMVNRHGAFVQDAPGRAGRQTHDPDRLRQAGVRSGWLWGKENQDLAYAAWREHINTLNIDWDRTLPGATEAEMDDFLKKFHQSVYSGVHGAAQEVVDPSKRLGVGSLSERISSERVLWFKDAQSEFEYNERWGVTDFNLGIISEIASFGRNVAMLQYLGPSAEQTFQQSLKTLRDIAATKPDAQGQGNKLARRGVQYAYDLLSGKAGTSVRPGLSRSMDFLKKWIIASKGGGIIFSMSGDRGFIDSGLAKQSATAMHRINVQLGRIASKTEDGQRLLKSIGFLAHDFAGGIAERISSDVRPFTKADSALGWFFRLQGATQLNDVHKMKAFSAATENLGSFTGKSWDELPVGMKTTLEGYQWTAAEWDAIRAQKDIIYADGADVETRVDESGTTTVIRGENADYWEVIDPTRMQDIPDEVIDGLLEAEGLKATTHNRNRKRDLLESKVGAYFQDIASEMVPTPGMRERIVMSGGGIQKGNWPREFLDLFFTFKGFGTTVALRNHRSYGKLLAAGQYQSVGMQVAMLLAQTTVLGYVGWAAREILKGRTPPWFVDDNGEVDPKAFAGVFMESMKRGGGMGIYGDYLLTEYNRDNRSFLESAAGPVLSELDPFMGLTSSIAKTAAGSQTPESLGLQSLRFAEANTPFLNLFYTKFLLDQFVLWNLKEGLSPGIFRRTERSINDQWMQEYFIDPVIE